MDLLSTILPWIQVILSVLIIVMILLQQSEAGMGSGFGGSGDIIKHTRRGFERVLFFGTIVAVALFAAACLVAFFLG
jgi:protein translocase SecG subunit